MHTKTTSQASKTGWLESKLKSLKYLLSYKPSHEEYNTGALGSLVVPSFDVNITTPSTIEKYIGSTGKICVRAVDNFYAIGSDGKPVLVDSTSLRNDSKWCECTHCGLFMRHTDYHRHVSGVNNKEIVTASDRIPAIPKCTKVSSDVSLNKAVLVGGEYKELFKRVPNMTGFKPEDAEDQIAYPEDLENPGLKNKPIADLSIKLTAPRHHNWFPYRIQNHSCLACQYGGGIEGICFTYSRPEIGYETMDELGRVSRIIGTAEHLVEVIRETPTLKPLNNPVAMIRFVRDSFNGKANNYFSVEINGKLRRFTVEENYKSEFYPMFRFTKGVSEHRLCHNGVVVALIDIEYSTHSDATMIRATNTNGELDEFYLPHTHEFFKYVVVEATVAEIMQ